MTSDDPFVEESVAIAHEIIEPLLIKTINKTVQGSIKRFGDDNGGAFLLGWCLACARSLIRAAIMAGCDENSIHRLITEQYEELKNRDLQ